MQTFDVTFAFKPGDLLPGPAGMTGVVQNVAVGLGVEDGETVLVKRAQVRWSQGEKPAGDRWYDQAVLVKQIAQQLAEAEADADGRV